jgi:hypothetical protein
MRGRVVEGIIDIIPDDSDKRTDAEIVDHVAKKLQEIGIIVNIGLTK